VSNRNIGIFERMGLTKRGKADAKGELINTCKIDEYLYLAQVPIDDESFGRDIECYISSFISKEFALFVDKRERLFRYQVCLLETAVEIQAENSSNIVQKLRFSDAITRLDKKIADLASELSVYLVACEDERKKIRLSIKKQSELIASLGSKYDMTHIVQTCETVTNEFQAKSNNAYKTILQLLNEKIRLIEDMRAKLEVVFARHLTRISYYLDAARMISPTLPSSISIGGILKAHSHIFILGRYNKILEEAENRRVIIENVLKQREVTPAENVASNTVSAEEDPSLSAV